jgi:hypothetical protein
LSVLSKISNQPKVDEMNEMRGTNAKIVKRSE